MAQNLHGKTVIDYRYCEDCGEYIDFWKYDHSLEAAGHENCRTRMVTLEELEECVKQCEEPFARCCTCDAIVEDEVDHGKKECGSCGALLSGNIRYENCFGPCDEKGEALPELPDDLAPFSRQITFRDDGSLTSIPATATERPQREAQGGLLQWAQDQAKMNSWRGN